MALRPWVVSGNWYILYRLSTYSLLKEWNSMSTEKNPSLSTITWYNIKDYVERQTDMKHLGHRVSTCSLLKKDEIEQVWKKRALSLNQNIGKYKGLCTEPNRIKKHSYQLHVYNAFKTLEYILTSCRTSISWMSILWSITHSTLNNVSLNLHW